MKTNKHLLFSLLCITLAHSLHGSFGGWFRSKPDSPKKEQLKTKPLPKGYAADMATIVSLKSQLIDAQKTITELRKQLIQKEPIISPAQTKSADLQGRLHECMKHNRRLGRRYPEQPDLQASIKKLKEEKRVLTQTLKEKEVPDELIIRAQEELKGKIKDNTKLQEQIVQLQQDNINLQNQTLALKTKNNKLQKKNTELYQKNRDLQTYEAPTTY